MTLWQATRQSNVLHVEDVRVGGPIAHGLTHVVDALESRSGSEEVGHHDLDLRHGCLHVQLVRLAPRHGAVARVHCAQ